MLNISQMPSSHLFGFTSYVEIQKQVFQASAVHLVRTLTADELQSYSFQQVEKGRMGLSIEGFLGVC